VQRTRQKKLASHSGAELINVSRASQDKQYNRGDVKLKTPSGYDVISAGRPNRTGDDEDD
jgi:hypothetical protein